MKTKPRIVEVQTEYDTPNTPPDCYRTADLPLAAYLRCQGVHLRSIHLVGRRAFFVFENGEYCIEMARNWANEDDCEVSGPVYSRELSKLKALAAKGSF